MVNPLLSQRELAPQSFNQVGALVAESGYNSYWYEVGDMTTLKGCPKCNHTGLLPFIKPDGSVSKYAKVFCPECYNQDQHEYSYPIKPSDWDFPMFRLNKP